MKYTFCFLFALFCISCEKNKLSEAIPEPDMIQGESNSSFKCVNAQADNPPKLSEAQKLIVGKWQLKGVIAMVENPQIPNYKVEFMDDGGVFVALGDKNVFTDAYSLIERNENNYRSIQLVTDGLLMNQEHNIVKGTIRICENELMVDQGIAFDAPGYLFRKIP